MISNSSSPFIATSLPVLPPSPVAFLSCVIGSTYEGKVHHGKVKIQASW